MRRFALAGILAAAWPAQAQMYKCVDERGVVHYADQPRPGCRGGPVNIQASPPISGRLDASGSLDVSRQEAEFKRRRIERELLEAQDRTALAQRCAGLRREHGILSSGIRVGRITDKGERVYMEDAERDSRMAKLREELRACP